MGLVCLSHFQDSYLIPLNAEVEALARLTRAATPAFILVSGFVLGFLFRSRSSFDEIRLKLVDRALFLLTVARVAIVASHVPIVGLQRSLFTVYVTDTIAVCVLVGTVLVPRVGMLGRAALGISVYALATSALVLWIPQPGSFTQFVKELLLGNLSDEPYVLAYNFPIVQWLGVYLIATALGEQLARVRAAGARSGIAALIGLGALLMASGILLWRLRPQLEAIPGLAGASHWNTLLLLTSPWQKLPPGPDYLLLYLGVGLLLVSACLWVEQSEAGALRLFTLLGRNSLFVFVVQYFIFYTLIFSLHLPYTKLWPLLFIVSFSALFPLTMLGADGRAEVPDGRLSQFRGLGGSAARCALTGGLAAARSRGARVRRACAAS